MNPDLVDDFSHMLPWLMESLPGGMIAINANKTVILANRSAYKILGLSREEYPLPGKDVSALLKAVAFPKPEASILLQSLETGKVMRKAEVVRAGRRLLVDAAPIISPDTGRVAGAAVYFSDVTDEQQANSVEQHLSKMERLHLVGQMAASIAHELRNPMTVIRGYMQYLAKKLGGQHSSILTNVVNEVDRCDGIINDFLALARNRNIDKVLCNLNDIIKEVWSVIVSDAANRGVKCRLALAPTLPSLLLNADEIKQLILNLAINGLEAMDDGGLLTISTSVSGNKVVLTVTDTGCGIADADLEYIFEPFYTTKTQGSGLGLPVCLSIIQGHGGKITVISTPKKGTTFTVVFPEH